MARAIASIPTRTVVRKLACTVVGVFLFAAGLTFLWLAKTTSLSGAREKFWQCIG